MLNFSTTLYLKKATLKALFYYYEKNNNKITGFDSSFIIKQLLMLLSINELTVGT
jgi:hypothetical protein